MIVRPLEQDTVWAGAAAQLLDDHTGGLPVSPATVAIAIADGTSWRPLGRVPVTTQLGVYAFPRLEKRGDARGASARKYKLQVAAPGYTPYYRFDRDGVEIDVYPYDDAVGPAVLPIRPEIIALYPSASYPFEADTPLLHGTVVDGAGAAVPNALVECQTERVLSDARGAFVLPMRRSKPGPAVVDASDRLGRTATVSITVPQGLGQRTTITL